MIVFLIYILYMVFIMEILIIYTIYSIYLIFYLNHQISWFIYHIIFSWRVFDFFGLLIRFLFFSQSGFCIIWTAELIHLKITFFNESWIPEIIRLKKLERNRREIPRLILMVLNWLTIRGTTIGILNCLALRNVYKCSNYLIKMHNFKP